MEHAALQLSVTEQHEQELRALRHIGEIRKSLHADAGRPETWKPFRKASPAAGDPISSANALNASPSQFRFSRLRLSSAKRT